MKSDEEITKTEKAFLRTKAELHLLGRLLHEMVTLKLPWQYYAIGAILWALRKRLTSLPGLLFSIYLFFNGVERFFIEFARINDRYDVLGVSLSQAQIIAICFMLAGLVSGWFFIRRARTLDAG